MANTADAIGRLAAASGWPEARLTQIATALRRESADLWPAGGLGKPVPHVEVHHLRNLLIACLGADVVEDAPQTAITYAALPARMRPVGDWDLAEAPWRQKPELRALAPLFPASGFTFGEAIDRLIEAHADAMTTDSELLTLMHARGLSIEIMRERFSARIVLNEPREGSDETAAGRELIGYFPGAVETVVRARSRLQAPAYLLAGVDARICVECAALVGATRFGQQK
jgi:hypothetical protein